MQQSQGHHPGPGQHFELSGHHGTFHLRPAEQDHFLLFQIISVDLRHWLGIHRQKKVRPARAPVAVHGIAAQIVPGGRGVAGLLQHLSLGRGQGIFARFQIAAHHRQGRARHRVLGLAKTDKHPRCRDQHHIHIVRRHHPGPVRNLTAIGQPHCMGFHPQKSAVVKNRTSIEGFPRFHGVGWLVDLWIG